MNRSKFIKVTLGATAAALLPALHYGCRHRITHNPVMRPEVLASFCDEQAIRKIGQDYLSTLDSSDAKRDALEARILAGYKNPASHETDREAMMDWIEKKVQDDFRNEKTVVIDGWVISITEASQCALLSLN